MPGLAVRGTFSPARAWRPAVVARLARTLGVTKTLPFPRIMNVKRLTVAWDITSAVLIVGAMLSPFRRNVAGRWCVSWRRHYAKLAFAGLGGHLCW